MKFYDILFFIDEEKDIPKVHFSDEEPYTVHITPGDHEYSKPSIVLYFKTEQEYITFKNNVHFGYENFLKRKGGTIGSSETIGSSGTYKEEPNE